MAIEIKMPSLGMAMDEGRVVAWRARAGDAIAKGQVLVEIEAEKTAFEIEAPADGTLAEIRHGAGETVAVGAVLAVIGGAPSADAETAAPPADAGPAPAEPVKMNVRASEAGRASPRAKRLARERGVDLAGIKGTGPGGTITADDVLAHDRASEGDGA